MWRSKKLIIVTVLAAVILTGSIGGIVLAADNGEDSQPEAQYGTLLDRACEIYEQETGVAIDQEALKDAFSQAQSELRAEAMQNRLQNLVDQGQITQEQADDYLKWIGDKPDIADGFGFLGRGGFRGMHKMRGFGGPCAPVE